MRILFLNTFAAMGGAETSLLALLAGLREAEPGWPLTLVLGADGPLVAKAKSLGVAVHVLTMPDALAKAGDSSGRMRAGMALALLHGFRYARELRRVIQQERPDAIHATGFKMHILGAWTRPNRVPLIWHMHDYVRSRRLMSRLLRWHVAKCDAAIANSQSVAADFLAAVDHPLPVKTIYNAVDTGRFSPEGPVTDLDALAGLSQAPKGTVRVGLAGTFAHWKGHRVFLRALSLLRADVPVRGYVIGGPIYQTQGSQETLDGLRAEAQRLNLGDRVGFTGFVDDASAAMRFLDVVVHASTSPEPFGMVIVEGMACGKAVIASKAGGAEEIIADGADAIGHAPGDAQALARAIERLASDRALRLRLGENARAKAESKYGIRRLGGELTQFYRELVGAGTGESLAVKAGQQAAAS